ncbi:MAG: hypothetical protein KF868_19150 [Acidobacteria bacterium]|nr:hypothetical protein [Acidobacteriota bacterium]MCW5970709.1 hypothetical protein [Blastocatellales bacterium]
MTKQTKMDEKANILTGKVEIGEVKTTIDEERKKPDKGDVTVVVSV